MKKTISKRHEKGSLVLEYNLGHVTLSRVSPNGERTIEIITITKHQFSLFNKGEINIPNGLIAPIFENLRTIRRITSNGICPEERVVIYNEEQEDLKDFEKQI